MSIVKQVYIFLLYRNTKQDINPEHLVLNCALTKLCWKMEKKEGKERQLLMEYLFLHIFIKNIKNISTWTEYIICSQPLFLFCHPFCVSSDLRKNLHMVLNPQVIQVGGFFLVPSVPHKYPVDIFLIWSYSHLTYSLDP